MFRPLRLLLTAVALLVMTAACGGDDPAAGSTTTAAPEATTAAPSAAPAQTTMAAPADFPVTVSSAAGEVTILARPERIAVLSATHVETLYAMGAGDQIVAGDLFSNHPAEAAALTRVDSFNLSVEAVVALDPDLVILSFDPVEAVPALEAVGIPTLLLGTAPSLEAAYGQMTTLGAATGNAEAAAGLVAGIETEIAQIVAGVGGEAAGITYYHETDPFSFYTPNSSSFIGRLYALLGMENIADAAPDEFGSGFPQLSPEFIIESDPGCDLSGGGR